ncbi:MAG: hypothetical protein IJI50_03480 [Ruminococcus sp.]|nr:hypothetical protein [Ruminococcus sp.]
MKAINGWNSDRLYHSESSFLEDVSKLTRLTDEIKEYALRLTASGTPISQQTAERIKQKTAVSQEIANSLESYNALFLYLGKDLPFENARSRRSLLYDLLGKREKALADIAKYCMTDFDGALPELHCFLRMIRCPDGDELFSEYHSLLSKRLVKHPISDPRKKDPENLTSQDGTEERNVADDSAGNSFADCLHRVKECTCRETARLGFESPLEAGLYDTGLSDRDVEEVFLKITESISPLSQEMIKCFSSKPNLSGTALTQSNAEELLYAALSPLSPRVSELLNRVFSDNWIDWYPQKGKLSGARHFRIVRLKESRIMLSFTGCLDDVFALSHELGHAWQASCMMSGENACAGDYGSGIRELGAYVFEQTVFEYLMQNAGCGMRTELLYRMLNNNIKLLFEVPLRYRFEKSLYKSIRLGERPDAVCLTAEAKRLITFSGAAELSGVPAFDSRFWIYTPALYMTDNCFYNYEYTLCYLEALTVCRCRKQNGDAAIQYLERILTNSPDINISDINRLLTDGQELFSGKVSLAKQQLCRVLSNFSL